MQDLEALRARAATPVEIDRWAAVMRPRRAMIAQQIVTWVDAAEPLYLPDAPVPTMRESQAATAVALQTTLDAMEARMDEQQPPDHFATDADARDAIAAAYQVFRDGRRAVAAFMAAPQPPGDTEEFEEAFRNAGDLARQAIDWLEYDVNVIEEGFRSRESVSAANELQEMFAAMDLEQDSKTLKLGGTVLMEYFYIDQLEKRGDERLNP